MLRELGTRAIPPQELARIAVPTSLIWGRDDRVMRPRVALGQRPRVDHDKERRP